MSWHNKVIWSEGMFLRPQHFQQQDRCFDHLLRQLPAAVQSYPWGFCSVEIDRFQLETGKLVVTRGTGVMPDGTFFSIPEEQDPPPPLDLTTEVRGQIVYLTMPMERSALASVELGSASDGVQRYKRREIEVFDISEESLGSRAVIEVGRIALQLKLESEPRTGTYALPLVLVSEVGNDRKIRLDERFIPPCLDYRASDHLQGFVRELRGLLTQRAAELAQRVSASGRGGVAEVADFLLLQVVNRLEPVVIHIAEGGHGHPEDLYSFLLAIAGELATFTTPAKRPPAFPPYVHDDLKVCFLPLEDEIRRSLLWMREPTAIAIEIEELGYGMRRAVISDRGLLESATFILEVAADLDADRLMREFRQQSKFGPRDSIRDLVMQALPGIGIRPRPTAPRQLPYHVNAVYFEIDTGNELWNSVQQSGVLALHVAGEFPGLTMTLWALKPVAEQAGSGRR